MTRLDPLPLRMVDLRLGDCLEVLQSMEDNSVDSIVTDPPYGLSQASKRNVRSLSSAMLEVVLPDLADLYAKRFSKAELPFPRDSVLFLDWALRSFGVETRVGVPKGAVDLKDDAMIRQEEIKATGIGPVGVPDGMLVNEVDSSLDKLLGEYVLSFRPLRHSAFSDCERIGLRQLGPSRFSVPVVVPADSDFACFLLAKPHGGATSFADFVGIEDDALAESQGSSSVVTGAAAELVVVLAFDTATGTCEVLPASGAGQVDLIAELVSTKRVAAGAATSGLPAVFKPHRVRLVGGVADGALTVNFHGEFLSCLNSSRSGFMGQAWDYDVPSKEIWEQCLRVLKPGGHLLAFAGTRTQHRMAVNIEGAGFEIRDMIAWCYGSGFPKSHNLKGEWEGFGTALKPALEPITMARKPFLGTVAANVLEHGTGAINIDGCRVGDNSGRWPANLIHDGSEEVTELFPQTTSGGGDKASKAETMNRSMSGKNYPRQRGNISKADTGSAARFFYQAKCSKADRSEGNSHPTVKPTDLMAYLCRLVTPPGGIVLDPFMGSGSTGKAAVREGFGFIGIEREDEYHAIALDRIMKEGMRDEQLSLTA